MYELRNTYEVWKDAKYGNERLIGFICQEGYGHWGNVPYLVFVPVASPVYFLPSELDDILRFLHDPEIEKYPLFDNVQDRLRDEDNVSRNSS